MAYTHSSEKDRQHLIVRWRTPSFVYWLGNKLYLNITNECSNNCYFCLRRFREGVGNFNLTLKKEPTVKEVISHVNKVLNKRNWSEAVFCGFGEPLERLDCILETVTWVEKHYGKPLHFRIDTNGHGNLLNSDREVIQELKNAGVGTVSVSLNAHDKATYDKVCRPKFKEAFPAVLKFIGEARKCLDVEATAVTIPEVDLSQVEMMAKKMDVKFRVRQYIPNSW